jgi:dethiobiotin synthetase
MGSVLSHHSPPIKNQKSKIKNLLCLIEGSGGLLVPLGKGYTVLDLITSLKCEVVVVARNRLGTINHTLLTIRALQAAGVKKPSVALMDCKQPDISSRSNYRILSQLLAPVSVHPVPFLTARRFNAWAIKKSALKLGRELSRFLLE